MTTTLCKVCQRPMDQWGMFGEFCDKACEDEYVEAMENAPPVPPPTDEELDDMERRHLGTACDRCGSQEHLQPAPEEWRKDRKICRDCIAAVERAFSRLGGPF